MRLKIICDKSNELVNLNKKLKKEFLKEKWVRECKVSYVSKTSNEADIYLIMSNELEYIYKNSYNIVQRKESKKLIIITSNLRSANIVGCLNITPYVYYTKNKIESLAIKIFKVYNKNKLN